MSSPGAPGYASAARASAAAPAHAADGRSERSVPAGASRWPLRPLLLGILAALLVAVSAVVGVVSVSVFHASAVERVDDDLRDAVGRVGSTLGGRDDPGALLDRLGIPPGTVVGFVRADGSVRAEYLGAPEQGMVALGPEAGDALAGVRTAGSPTTVELGAGLGGYRATVAFRAIELTTGVPVTVVVALPLRAVDEATARLSLTILSVALGGLLLALGAGWFIVGRALAPLERMTATAQRVSELPLDRGEVEFADVAVAVDERSEVGRLGGAFDRMLGHVGAALSAREASERKVRRFVADASHELRTPLASIRGYSELVRLHGGELPDEVLHALGRIEAESMRMTGLVEDLLLLARLDEGRELERGPVDLTRIAVETLGDAQAAGPGHDWELDVPERPVVVTGDEARLRQVVVNLLANARVHTPDGTRVRLALRRDGAQAVLEVADDGPGIPPELAGSLFERFARGDSSRSRRAGSTGLGLAIVRAVVDAHGGTVAADGGAGARFTVRLALAPDDGAGHPGP